MKRRDVKVRELKRLGRAELLELLLEESQENASLRSRVRELEKQLNDREIEIENAGSIAEAALRLNGVFEAAEEAAKQYLENIRRLAEEEVHEQAENGDADDGADREGAPEGEA